MDRCQGDNLTRKVEPAVDDGWLPWTVGYDSAGRLRMMRRREFSKTIEFKFECRCADTCCEGWSGHAKHSVVVRGG